MFSNYNFLFSSDWLSFFQKDIPAYFQKNVFFNKLTALRFSTDQIHIYLSAVGAGILTGFIFHRYFKLVLTSVLLTFFIIKGLEYQGVLKMNWNLFAELTGIAVQNLSLEAFAAELYKMFLGNLQIALLGAIGFIIGYKAA